ncbi:hypothetical protein [Wenyingzhuangia sp. IMCC45467]
MKILNFLMLTIILSSCSSVKYFGNFKKEKKKINEITILTPIVSVIEKEKYRTSINQDLSIQNSFLIDSISNKLLSNKYEKVESKKQQYSNLENLDEILNKLDNSDNNNLISLSKIFENKEIMTNNEYAILFVYNARYNPKFEPHYRTTSALSGMVVITPGEKITSNSNLRMMVLNTKTKQVELYDKIETLKFDPRVTQEVVQLTRTLIKKMYYK